MSKDCCKCRDGRNGRDGRDGRDGLPGTPGTPAFIPSFANFWNTADVAIAINTPLPFNATGVKTADINLNGTNDGIIFGTPGTYEVSWIIAIAAAVLGTVGATLDGVPVPGSQFAFIGTGLSGQTILTSAAGQVLALLNGGVAITLATGTNVSININRIA